MPSSRIQKKEHGNVANTDWRVSENGSATNMTLGTGSKIQKLPLSSIPRGDLSEPHASYSARLDLSNTLRSGHHLMEYKKQLKKSRQRIQESKTQAYVVRLNAKPSARSPPPLFGGGQKVKSTRQVPYAEITLIARSRYASPTYLEKHFSPGRVTNTTFEQQKFLAFEKNARQ